MSDTMTELFGEPISVYTRARAIADGVLHDVTPTAKEAGFTIPVALTHAVWVDCVLWDEEIEARKPQYTGQDEAGRLWDVLFMAHRQIRAHKAAAFDGPRMPYQVLRVPPTGRGFRPRLVDLVLHLGGGDLGEPVITIMGPHES